MLDLVREATKNLVEELGEKVIAIALFGSMARGEAGGESDVDILVVVKGMPKGLKRRFVIYDIVYKTLRRDVTIIDEDEEIFEEDLEITPMLLHIAWDSLVIYDPSGRLSELFERIKTIIDRLKLERYRTTNGKYGWKSTASGRLKAVKV